MPFATTPSTNTPITVPTTEPRPPPNPVPPRITDAMIGSSRPCAAYASPVPVNPASTMPLNAANSPLSTYICMRRRSTGMPASRAIPPPGLPPIA